MGPSSILQPRSGSLFSPGQGCQKAIRQKIRPVEVNSLSDGLHKALINYVGLYSGVFENSNNKISLQLAEILKGLFTYIYSGNSASLILPFAQTRSFFEAKVVKIF